MELSIVYDEANSLFTVRLIGNLDQEGLVNSINLYTNHPAWGPTAKLILDYRECLLKALSPPEIQAMAKVTSDLSDKIGPVRIGVVMSDQHDYGMARFWQIKAESESPFKCKVFLDPEQAMEWLLT